MYRYMYTGTCTYAARCSHFAREGSMLYSENQSDENERGHQELRTEISSQEKKKKNALTDFQMICHLHSGTECYIPGTKCLHCVQE